MPDTIITQDVLDGYVSEMARYAIADNRRRMIPDIKDGLKPVQRRVLYSMAELGAVSRATKKKSARIVGDCMGKYHPHGDCLYGGTLVYLLDGNVRTLAELAEENASVDVLSIDPETGEVVPAVAHDFRIGQYADKIYHIVFSNSGEVVCTSNHPFMKQDGTWVRAEDITVEMTIMSCMAGSNSDGSHYAYKYGESVNAVWVENTDNMPMYDFTVDGFENMLIPTGPEFGNRTNLVCVHNSSIYGCIRPMANWYECKIPLSTGWGNWGTFQGDDPAAMRYTEAYLSEFTVEFMRLLGKYDGIVDWSPNFDSSEKEPDYLPFMIPVLLINGASGIGVGVKMEIPPHNPHEVIDITRKLLRDPTADVVLIPDFCMPCEIVDTNWKQISNIGNGKFRARGLTEIGEYKGYPAVFIKSLPQGVNTGSITAKLNKMTQSGAITQIRNILWEGSEKEVNLVIQLKKGESPEYVRELIYKSTQLEQGYNVNFEAIYGIEHLRFSYKSYLELFIDTAKMTLFRMYCQMYQEEMTRWHELDAYVKVIQSGEVDNIYKSIRKSKSEDMAELVDWLCKKLGITDMQAGYIIKSSLGKFSKGYLEKYLGESKGCYERAQQYRQIILNDDLIVEELDKVLERYDKKFGSPRLCRVVKESDTSTIPKGTFTIVITENNYIRKLPEDATVNTVKGDRPNFIVKAENDQNILIFADTGKVFKVPVHKIGATAKSASGVDIRTVVKGLTSDICEVMYEPTLNSIAKLKRKHYIMVTTAGNTIKKLDLEDFLTVPPSGIIYTKLVNGDRVTDVSIVPNGSDIVVYSDHKALRMSLNDVNNYKRNAIGVTAMKTNGMIEGANVIYDDTEYIVVITKGGKINKFVSQGLERGKRAMAGSSVIKLGSKDSIFGVYGVNDSIAIQVITSDGEYTINTKDVPIGSSVASGSKIPGIKSSEVVVKAKLYKV